MRVTKMVTVAGLAICAVALAAAPASAHGTPFTVTAGSAPMGTTVPVTLTTVSENGPGFMWKDTTTNVLISCTSVTLRGALTTGSAYARVGMIDAARSTFTNCTGPAGWKFLVTGFGTWTLDVHDSTSGVSTVTVGNVRAHLSATSGPNCNWDFAASSGAFASSSTATTDPGSLATTYDNNAATLGLDASSPGSLGLWNVKGGTSNKLTYCLSQSVWKQGDRISWSANWAVTGDTPAYNPVAVN